MKRSISTLFLAFIASTCMLSAQNGTCGDNLVWNLTDGVLTISGTGVMTDFEWKGTPWYSYQENITSLIIGNSVTSIGSSAFWECSGLMSVTIGNSVTSIGDRAFCGCSGLTSVAIPNSVTSIEYGAFHGCSGLTSIEVPNSVTSIEEGAFYNCSSLTSVTIPNSVTSIGNSAFSGCSGLPVINNIRYADTYLVEAVDKSLSSYTIKDDTKWIGDYAFYNCSGMTSIEIPNSVTSIGYCALRGCTGLTALLIPNSVNSIEYGAFEYCSNLTNVTIPNSVTSIGGYAFRYCSGLTSIELPNSLTSIEGGVFNGCSGLTSITIPNSVTSIGDETFSGCSSLCAIEIPENITSIGNWAFYNTPIVKIICKPMTPPIIGNTSFPSNSNYNSYPTIYVPCGTLETYRNTEGWTLYKDSIQYPPITYQISTHANEGWVEIHNNCDHVTLTAHTNTQGYVFKQWSDGNTENPRNIVITQDTTFTAEFSPVTSGKCGDEAYWDLDTISGVLMISGNGAMYDYNSTTLPWRKYAQYITSAQVQEGITHLSAYAFENIRTLLNVHLPSTLETMGDMSFYCAVNIGTITCDAIIPPTGGTFKGVNRDAVIYVPCGTKGAYTDSNNWGWYFPNIEDGSYEFIEDTLICNGADLNWRGHYHLPYYSDTVIYYNGNSTLYKFGGVQATFPDSLKTMQGCDSVYVLNAYIAPHYYEIIYDTINEGESHWAVRGNILSDTVHYNYYSTILGCDSIQEWHITVLPKSFPAPDYMFERLYGDCASKLKFTNTSHVINKFEGYENHTSYPCDACRWTFRSLSNSVIYTTTEWSPIYTCPEEGDTIEVTLTAYLGYESDSTRIDTIIVPNIMPQHTEFFYITTEDSPIKFDGRWFNRDTTYIAHYFNTYGCDSTSTLHLHVIHNYTISLLANSSKYGYVEGSGIYKQDTTITITAIPNKGYQFNQWSDGNTDNPRQVIVTQDSVFTAIFGVKMCSWLVESNDLEMGAVITNFNNEYYQYGTQITVEASPNSGYKFVKWNDGKKFNPYKFSILDDKYLLAIFMEEEEEQDTTTVSPTSTTATFTWPFIIGGFSYSLTIYLDAACTIPFCTITFNQYGQLIGITFGNRAPRRTMEQEDGFTYTVSGLDANTEYYFKMETMDEDNKLINTDEGAFRTTNEATGIENQYNNVIEHRKVMINGQIYIIRGDKTYTLQGQEVK